MVKRKQKTPTIINQNVSLEAITEMQGKATYPGNGVKFVLRIGNKRFSVTVTEGR